MCSMLLAGLMVVSCSSDGTEDADSAPSESGLLDASADDDESTAVSVPREFDPDFMAEYGADIYVGVIEEQDLESRVLFCGLFTQEPQLAMEQIFFRLEPTEEDLEDPATREFLGDLFDGLDDLCSAL